MTTPQTARALALIAAAQARIAGMQAENQNRMNCDNCISYGEDAFMIEADALERISIDVINQ